MPTGSGSARTASAAELEARLVDLYVYVYDADPDAVRLAADLRAEAADLSDTWVAAGSRLDDPRLARERETLIASYTALRDVRGRDATD